ncbi:hypothetical protein H4219_003887 [Mycoemilia scoparia]|uniref:Uncharacterized protein n=1 Tax=Mycoemilia scoparia TaxID=417184 RepID=A0A9W8A1I3_9FUNG|nr:hypothetical protein H4219_003887 [Mycoemilia scoparia]
MTNGVEEIIRRLPHSTLHQQPELRAETEPLANNDAQPKKDYNEGEEEIEEENYDEYNNAIVKVSKLRFIAIFIDANTGNGKLIGYLLLFGTGVGITMSGLMVAIQINVNRDIISIATAVANFSWSIGGAIGLPAMSSVFVNVLTNRLGDLARQHPDHARSIMMSRNNNNAVWNSGLPDNVRSQLVDAYVETLCLLYQILIPICSFALIFALFLKGKKLRPSRMPTEQEKDDSHATLESTV